LEEQAIPIDKPDANPKRQWRKKKEHGKADARALTGAEIAEKLHYEQEAALNRAEAAKAAGTTPPPGTRKAGES